jgi:hypothetical protein
VSGFYSDVGQTFVSEFLSHHGVKGMKWGVRRGEVHPDIAHIPKATRKEAAKDAEEFTRAKLYFGEGAGTRRKLIKASVESKRKKDSLYGEAFDHFVKQTDLGIRAQQARKQRSRTDRRKSNKRALKKVLRTIEESTYHSDIEDVGQTFVSEFLSHHGVKE